MSERFGVTCDHMDCGRPSVGYVDRQLQGPFYCDKHKEWAHEVAARQWAELARRFDERADDAD